MDRKEVGNADGQKNDHKNYVYGIIQRRGPDHRGDESRYVKVSGQRNGKSETDDRCNQSDIEYDPYAVKRKETLNGQKAFLEDLPHPDLSVLQQSGSINDLRIQIKGDIEKKRSDRHNDQHRSLPGPVQNAKIAAADRDSAGASDQKHADRLQYGKKRGKKGLGKKLIP